MQALIDPDTNTSLVKASLEECRKAYVDCIPELQQLVGAIVSRAITDHLLRAVAHHDKVTLTTMTRTAILDGAEQLYGQQFNLHPSNIPEKLILSTVYYIEMVKVGQINIT